MRSAAATLIVAATAALAAAPAPAALFAVDTTEQGTDVAKGDGICRNAAGRCSIRAALEEANALGGADEVRVPPGSYAITEATLAIASSLKLVGTGGARATTLTAGPALNTLLRVSGGGVVTVEGLTLTGVTGSGPTLDVGGPDTTLRGLAVRDNATTFGTGGIQIGSGEVTVIRSSITGNEVRRTDDATGGGMVVWGGTATIVATTVAGNRATSTGVGSKTWGGGIALMSGSATLRHVTLRDNVAAAGSAAAAGGNLYANAPLQVRDSILAGGAAAGGPNCYRFGATAFTATGRNIYPAAGTDNCPFPAGTIAASSAALSPLGDHGGPGLSLVPVLPSTAFDAASGCPDGGRDQRGAPAPTGAACDIGATELGADLRMSLTATPASAAPGAPIALVATVANAGLDASPATQLTFASSTAPTFVTPSTGSCSGAAVCSLGALAAGQTATVVAVVPAPASGALTASASASGGVPDPTPADATASAAVPIQGSTGSGPGEPDGPLPPVSGPVVSGLGAKGRLHVGRGGTLKGRLSADATVRIDVARLVPGRRVGGRCRAGARRGRRCETAVRVGTVSARRAAGAFTVALPARFGRRALAAGRYRLTATAVDVAGRRSASAASAAVRVLPPAPPRRGR